MMRILIVIAGLLLAGCSIFSAPTRAQLDSHNRISKDGQIDKWSRGLGENLCRPSGTGDSVCIGNVRKETIWTHQPQ